MDGNGRSVPARVSVPSLWLGASRERREEELRQDALCPFKKNAQKLLTDGPPATLGLPAPPTRPFQISL